MIARVHKAMKEKDQGFTLIELLVVVIIIGILSAIAIPAFLNQRKKAVDASIKSDLRTVAENIETYYTDNLAYPATAEVTASTGTATPNTFTIGSGTTATSITLSSGNVVTYKLDTTGANTGQAYVLVGSNPKGTATGTADSKVFVYDSDNGGLNNSVTAPPA